MDSASALNNLQNYQKSILSADQASNQANEQLGVSGAQQQVQGLRGAIARTSGLLQQVAPSVYGRTQGSLVTNAQAGRQIQNEQAPIAQQLETQNRDYGSASEDYKDLLGRAQAKASGTLQEQQGQISYLQQIYQNIAAKEQADRDEAYRQSSLAEQRRQADLQASTARATARNAAGGSASPSFSTGSSGGSGYAMTRDNSGGFQFSAGGKPVTAGQYVNANGGGWSDLLKLMSSSGNKGDQQIAREMAGGASPQQLKQKYPYVFGGM